MMQKQKGFSILHLLLMFVVIGIVGGTGWYIFRANRSLNETLANSDKSSSPKTEKANKSTDEPKPSEYTPVVPDGWNVYKDDKYKFSFAYPKEWGDLHDETYPGGAYDASKEWFVHKVTDNVKDSDGIGIFNNLAVDVNAKEYREFRTVKAGTPHAYVAKNGTEYWVASSIDISGDDYEPGDVYPVPVEKVIKGSSIFKVYGRYENYINSGWRFAVKDGIVTINLPMLGAYDWSTGAEKGDKAAYDKLRDQVLNSINIE